MFVYASDVMMTVATGFDAPMKVLIPNGQSGYNMLGIGDIIVPGLLVSLCKYGLPTEDLYEFSALTILKHEKKLKARFLSYKIFYTRH